MANGIDRRVRFLTTLSCIAAVLPATAQPRAEAPATVELPVDTEGAQVLARRNDCFKCHAIDKVKNAPPYRRIAGRLKSKPDAVEVIVKHITTGPLVQLEDGRHEEHRIIDTKNPAELGNLARWILSL